MVKELKDEPKLKVAKERENKILKRVLRDKDDSRKRRKDPKDEEESRDAVVRDGGIGVEGAAASPSANHTASSSSSATGSPAPKLHPTHVAQGEDKRQKNPPLSVKRGAEVDESQREVNQVRPQGLG